MKPLHMHDLPSSGPAHTHTHIMQMVIISITIFSFPPPFITGKSSNQWLLDAYQTDFSRWLPSNTASTIKK